jgi:hypothetical protein
MGRMGLMGLELPGHISPICPISPIPDSFFSRPILSKKSFHLLPFVAVFQKMVGWTCPVSSNRCSLRRIGP